MKLRKILAVVLALALVCATFGACGNDAGTSGSSGTTSTTSEGGEAETGTTGGELDLRSTMEPTSLNTLLATYAYDFTPISAMVECLYRIAPDDSYQPAAAETVDISEDQKVYTFHLREDAKWSNGDPVIATDFEFAWKQALSPEVASNYAYMLFFIHNAEAYLAGKVEWEEVGVKVLDDYTLEVTLDNPLPYANNLFGFYTLAPINQKFYEEVGADLYATDPEYFCTNGMYLLTEWEHNSEIVFEKNPDYWNAAEVGPDKITYKIITDDQAALNSYLSKEIDFNELDTGETVQQVENAGLEVGVKPARSTFYVMCNTANEFLGNVNLRKALSLAYDKQALVDTVYQNDNLAATSFVPPATFGAAGAEGPTFQEALLEKDGELWPANGDVEQAKQYLETALSELGCTAADITLSIDCGDSAQAQAYAAFLQEQWRVNLGLENVTINPMQTKQVSANRNSGDYCMSLAGWSPDYNDPMTFLDMWVTGGGNNQTGWGSEEYDQLIDSATAEVDQDARQEMLYQCEEILAEECPILLTYWECQNYSYNSEKIVGGEVITANQTNFWYAEIAE